jgi:hypothetical protein
MRQIARDQQHGYWAIRKALESAEHQPYALTKSKPAPKLGPYKAKIDKLLAEDAKLPRKQRNTTHKIYELMQAKANSIFAGTLAESGERCGNLPSSCR